MNTPLTIVARIEAKPDRIELVKAELLKLIEPTREEKGCIQYDLHQDNERPELFLFYENWKNRTLWQAHMENIHLKSYLEATADAIADFKLNEMSRIA